MSVKDRTFSFWNDNAKYFDAAHSDEQPLLANPALMDLYFETVRGGLILDIGCGDGSKIKQIVNENLMDTRCVGIDASSLAIALARANVPSARFYVEDIENIHCANDHFDLVFSTYVFEHTTNPQKVLDEMIRVCKAGGKVVVVCPNFGSPLYPSPITPPFMHARRALWRDVKYFFKKPTEIDWFTQEPVLTEDWKPDWDTTIMPYARNLAILYPSAVVSSTWRGMSAGDNKIARIIRLSFKALGLLGVSPFKWWGSTLYFEYRKPV